MSQQLRLVGKFAKKSKVERCRRFEFKTTNSRSSQNDVVIEPKAIGAVSPPIQSGSCHSSQKDEDRIQVETQTWKHGRRIVELHHMAQQMFCNDCKKPLHLLNIVQETRHGFGSILLMECECGFLNTINTGKTHRVSKTGPPVFDVNSKAAIGMLHSGSGHTQLTNFFATLEIEGLHHTTMKRREKEVESQIKAVALKSCAQALALEIKKQQETDCPDADQSAPTPGQFKYDMGWQKRGSGRSYDSKSGVGTLIGNQTGKICAYGVKTKDCRVCSYHNNKGNDPPPHNCVKNWTGSSKAMEASVAAESINKVEQSNMQVSVLIMDDDTTTMARINADRDQHISKWSDINHTKKHLGNSLYSLKKQHKHLSNKSIQYLQKCFGYAIAQNKNDPVNMKASLCQIVPHSFGDHENCNPEWCGYLRNPDTYRHKSLPHGVDLSGDSLKADLNAVFETFINNVDKIAPGASTKDVESFNNVLASKAPKRIHYSASSSLHNRVNCAVAEKNLGSTYVNKINEELGFSPGQIYRKIAEKKDNTRKRRLSYENTRSFKKRKLERKMNKSLSNAQYEVREGITYQSSIDITESNSDAVIEIPPPVLVPVINNVDLHEPYTQVFCDIETTSLSKTCDIVQIAAVTNQDTFTHYILPSQPIQASASNVTGLSMHGNTLFLHNRPVPTDSLKEVLTLFLSWLDDRKPCVLIGHNFRVFDFPRILRAFDNCHLLSPFKQCVHGIIDTLPLFKDIYPGLANYKQEQLVLHILKQEYKAHNAEEDVESLQKLFNHADPGVECLSAHSATTSSMIEMNKFHNQTDMNLQTLSVLFETKVISKAMCSKIARSGLQFAHLRIAHSRGGLYKVLSEKINGKPRVTKKNTIIQKITDFFNK